VANSWPLFFLVTLVFLVSLAMLGGLSFLYLTCEEQNDLPHSVLWTMISFPPLIHADHTSNYCLNAADVHFTYPQRPEAAVLKGVNLTLKRGTVTALVGESGAGKSTVVQLLSRFYEVRDQLWILSLDSEAVSDASASWRRERLCVRVFSSLGKTGQTVLSQSKTQVTLCLVVEMRDAGVPSSRIFSEYRPGI
jgi:ABC-type transport system involved in cytochrome bd biosynthesis fused ATPase/permease subunit